MAAKLTAGDKLEKRSKPAPSQQEVAEAVAKVSEKFPDTFKESLVLLQSLTAEPVANEAEWDAKQPRLKALKQHVFNIQQGLPIVHASGNDEAAIYEKRRAGLQRTRLELLAREDVAVKELLAAHDALVKQAAEFTKQKTTE